MKFKLPVFILLMFFACSSQETNNTPADFVDPFICTQGDHGQWHPSALVPFGLVKLGPDSWPSSLTGNGDFAHSGYNYSDDHVRGFSHFRKGSSGGGGIKDRAGLLSIFPFTKANNKMDFTNPVEKFDKKNQKAQPGYYEVELENHILVQLTATVHAGFHSYTFPSDSSRKLYINPGNWQRTSGLDIKQDDSTQLSGFLKRGPSNTYFIMQFSDPIKSISVFQNNKMTDTGKLDGKGGLILEFEKSTQPLLVKVGVSLTSLENAKNNLAAELDHWNFLKCRQDAKKQWNDRLSTIMVEGDNEYKTIFYTALYHTCFLPVIITDVDGSYPGLDKQVHKAKGYIHFDDYAFWDSFRTKYPFYSLAFPDVYQNVYHSLYDIYEQADNWKPFPDCDHAPHGYLFLNRGVNGYQPYGTCRHEHMLMVMTDAWVKGLDNVDMNSVYPYLRREALVQMPEKYDKIGYIPARPDQTGEYSWDSWCVAQAARGIGNESDYNYFMKRAQYWKNTWDPSIKFNRARAANGTWLDFPDDPTVNREKYTYEGSKWHWRWNAVHDVNGMIKVFDGRENFINQLDYFFNNDLYTAGNQIDLHTPFLFNFAGAPWLTQKWVRKILTEPMVQRYGTHNFFETPIFDRIYKTTPDGYLEEMDGDYGCMAAWYNLSSIGLYQICPGQPVYQITAPIFKKVKINLNRKIYPGKTFVMQAPNVSAKNIYIQSAKLYDANGNFVRNLTEPWMTHSEITKGGKIIFKMGDKPNKMCFQN